MKKFLTFIGGLVVIIVILVIAIFGITSLTSKQLVCTSDKVNITIMYSDKKINGYKAKGISFDMGTAQNTVEEIGMDEYIKEFNKWFEENTDGTCEEK